MPQTLDTFNVAFQAEQPHQLSDRFEGFLTMIDDGTWTVEIYDATTERFSFPIAASADPFEAVQAATAWVVSAE